MFIFWYISSFVAFAKCCDASGTHNRFSGESASSIYSDDADPFHYDRNEKGKEDATTPMRPSLDYFNYNPGPSIQTKETGAQKTPYEIGSPYDHLSPYEQFSPYHHDPLVPHVQQFSSQHPQLPQSPHIPHISPRAQNQFIDETTKASLLMKNNLQQNKNTENSMSEPRKDTFSSKDPVSPFAVRSNSVREKEHLSRQNSHRLNKALLSTRKSPSVRSPPANYHLTPNNIVCPLCHTHFGRVEILKEHLDVHIT